MKPPPVQVPPVLEGDAAMAAGVAMRLLHWHVPRVAARSVQRRSLYRRLRGSTNMCFCGDGGRRRARAGFYRGGESWWRRRPDEDRTSWSLVVFFMHLDSFIVGEIVEEWQWWRPWEWGRRGGRDRGLSTSGHRCQRAHAQLCTIGFSAGAGVEAADAVVSDNLDGKRYCWSAFCHRVASKWARGTRGQTHAASALTHRFPKFGAPMGHDGRIGHLRCPAGVCAGCPSVREDHFG
jgi:hypothetical protein